MAVCELRAFGISKIWKCRAVLTYRRFASTPATIPTVIGVIIRLFYQDKTTENMLKPRQNMKLGESSSISYRPDVDGLRAIAVLAVLIFHFFPISLPGGYIGVDIFFVISGYLVTAILEQNIKSGRFSFYKFYAKRARRLFPALIAVLVAVLLIGLLLLVSDELESLSKHIFSGTIFISNFILYSESGYFDRSVELKPLMHLWSLAVEEQFYILWPVLIYLAFRKGEKFLKFSLTFVFAISLAASIFLTRKNPSMSFYLLPTRLWELAAGGLLASQGRGAWARICSNRWIGQVLPWLGLATCVYGFLKFDAHTTFPSYRALIPVLGTLLIVGSGERSFLAKVLSHPKVVYVGLISYPLYLWHWPLISFAYIFYNKENLPSSIVWILFALSFVIAAATYEWLEKPLKRLPLTKYKIGNVVLSLFGVGIIGSTIWSLRGLPSRFAEVENLRSSHLRFSATEETQINSECIKALFPIEMCAITEPSKLPTVVILGDSHANHFFPGLQDYYSKSGDNLALLAKSGTPPLVGVVSQRAEDSSLGDVFEFISRSPNVHTVILAAFWGNYFEESGVQVSNLLYKNRIAE
ncbi:MAG: acyltransferase, partial [Proteobacteria bacterium]